MGGNPTSYKDVTMPQISFVVKSVDSRIKAFTGGRLAIYPPKIRLVGTNYLGSPNSVHGRQRNHPRRIRSSVTFHWHFRNTRLLQKIIGGMQVPGMGYFWEKKNGLWKKHG